MGLTTALDVAIGLIFMYLVFSLLCTSVNEAIASILRLRARMLATEIRRILDDDQVRARFWNTGLILSLTRVGAAPAHTAPGADADLAGSDAPSYIGGATFARALVQAAGIIGTSAGQGATPASPLDGLSDNSVLKKVLLELQAEAGNDIAALRQGIARWFDQVMERTTGLYRRRLKLISFLVALGIAVLINADSIKVARSLWFDETLRSQIVQSAFQLVEQGGYADEMMEFAEIQEQLRPFPIGWDFRAPGLSTDWYRSPSGALAKVVGLLLTAFAAMLGAPFWFDLLSKFMKVRGAGPAEIDSAPGAPKTDAPETSAPKPDAPKPDAPKSGAEA